MLVAHTFVKKSQILEKEIANNYEFEEKYVWTHSLVRGTQIF